MNGRARGGRHGRGGRGERGGRVGGEGNGGERPNIMNVLSDSKLKMIKSVTTKFNLFNVETPLEDMREEQFSSDLVEEFATYLFDLVGCGSALNYISVLKNFVLRKFKNSNCFNGVWYSDLRKRLRAT